MADRTLGEPQTNRQNAHGPVRAAGATVLPLSCFSALSLLGTTVPDRAPAASNNSVEPFIGESREGGFGNSQRALHLSILIPFAISPRYSWFGCSLGHTGLQDSTAVAAVTLSVNACLNQDSELGYVRCPSDYTISRLLGHFAPGLDHDQWTPERGEIRLP